MFERFTDRARRVIVLAQDEARNLKHNYLGTEHILLGLIREGEGVAAKALEALDITLDEVRAQVIEIIGEGQEPPSGHIPFTPRAKKVIEYAMREGLQLGHSYIGTEHLLLGLTREPDGVAAQVLTKLGRSTSSSRASRARSPSASAEAPGKAEGRVDHPRPVRPQSDAVGARPQARSRHRAPPGDRTGHAGPVAPHQEQPRADRRAGRRQDGRRRRPRTGHRRGRRARDP